MLIRSQDKKTIVNLDNVDTICLVDGMIKTFNGEGDSESIIASYFTEEKAIKVLDMIQDAYLSRMELEGGYDILNGVYVQPNFWVLPKVFQMPQDSEV